MAQHFLRNDRRLSFFVKYCIQGPFAEIVTAVIKAWRFLEGVSSPLAEKKGEAEAGASYALRY